MNLNLAFNQGGGNGFQRAKAGTMARTPIATLSDYPATGGGGDGGVNEAAAAGPAPEQEFQVGEEGRAASGPPGLFPAGGVHSRSGLPRCCRRYDASVN